MAGSRALPDLVSRIRVDSSGVETAIGSLVTSFNKADLKMAAAAAGIGLLVLGGKSAMDIAEKHEKAEADLSQAMEYVNSQYGKTTAKTVDLSKQRAALAAATRKLDELEAGLPTKHKATTLQLMHLQDAERRVAAARKALTAAQAEGAPKQQTEIIYFKSYRAEIDAFIKSNRNYISDQAEVIDNYAKLTRSGLKLSEVNRVMNDAVDLAALKHISLSDAVDVLNAAEHGRMKGLIDLGITTKQLTDKNGNLLKGQKAISAAMTEVDKKVAGGRETLTKTEQASHKLSNAWQDIANKVGPPLLDMFSTLVDWLSQAVDWLNNLGDNKDWNKAISDGLGVIQNFLVGPGGVVQSFEDIVNAVQWLADNGGKVASWLGSAGSGTHGPGFGPGRAGGGPVLPNSIYTVGEDGPEQLVMGPRGGYVIPNSGGGNRGGGGGNTVNVYVAGSVMTERNLNLAVREGIRRLDREQR